MSVKIMGLVWDLDLPCPEKLVLLAYTDHADHEGRNIYPAVNTIAKKTGYSERSVQVITRKLEAKNLLINDGKGPKGTNKWRFGRGAESAGVQDEAQGGAELDGGGAESRTKGVQPTAPEPSLTINIEPSKNHHLPDKSGKENLYPLATAIASVCGVDLELNSKQIFSEAKILSKKITPDRIYQDYGEGGSWYLYDWRGKQNQKPTVDIIRKTIGTYDDVDRELPNIPDGFIREDGSINL